jgi:PAS domain S-box-containing protein
MTISTRAMRSGVALERWPRAEAAVAELAVRALRDRDLPALAALAAQRAAAVLRVEMCHVLASDRNGRFVPVAAHGFGTSWSAPISAEDCPLGTSAEGADRAVVDDLAADGRLAASPVVRDHGALSAAAVRITDPDGRPGILAAYARERRSFSADDLGFLRAVADVLAAAASHRRADEISRQTEERFRLMVESVEDYAIFMLDPDGRVASWNAGAERLKGYRAEEIIGQHFSRFYPAEELAAGKPERELALAERDGRFEDEGWRLRKDGSRFWANVVVTALTGPDGTARGFAKVTRDFTARRRAEETARQLAAESAARRAAELAEGQLRESEERARRQKEELEAILNAVADGVVVQEREGALRYLNDAAARACGFASAREMRGASGDEVLARFDIRDESGLRLDPDRLPGRAVLRGEQPGSLLVHVRDRSSGRAWWSQVTARALPGPDGRPAVSVTVWHDVTDRRRSEEASRFLAEASAVLNADLAYRSRLEQIARLSVPRLADWCVVDVMEGDALSRVAVAHPAEREREAGAVRAGTPPDPDAPRGARRVARTGVPELYREISEEVPVSPADAAYLDAAKPLGVRSAMIVPIAGRTGTLGAITFAAAESGRRYGPADLELAQQLGRHAGLAVENARLFESEHRARATAERSMERLGRLQALTAALAGALTPADVANAVVEEGVRALGARAGGCWLVSDDGTRAELVRSSGADRGVTAAFDAIRLDGGSPNPVADAIRGGQALWFESPQAFAATYPAILADGAAVHAARFRGACLPLAWAGRTRGVLAYGFEGAAELEGDERAFLLLLASQCAQALERSSLYQQAIEAVSVRDDFLSIAGHELKTPLTALLFHAESLARAGASVAPEDLARRTGRLASNAERLGRLVDELLDVSRITAGRLVLEREPVDLAAVAREVVLRSADELARSGSSVRLTAPAAVCGRWDRPRVEQVAGNLLANAIKYGQGRPIDVRVEAEGRTARLLVRDRGVGIAADDQARIFDRFERAVSARHFGGLGLGLWIVRQVVEAHGGRIRVQSAPGEGAEFTVELPLDEVEVTP